MAAVIAAVALGAAAPSPAAAALTPTQRHVADQLVSVFENSSLRLRYDYVEDLHDGCGLTAGRAGFCSATGDMLETVDRYARARPGDRLATFLPELRRLAAAGSDRTRGLGPAFAAAWRLAAGDARFRHAQDQVVDDLYYRPAARTAGTVGLTTPLGVAILYDTAIEHGVGHDPDGLPALVTRTSRTVGGDPAGGVSERRWLTVFLRVRRADLSRPFNRDRRVDWPQSTGRVDALAALLEAGDVDLRPPLRVDPWGDHTFVLGG